MPMLEYLPWSSKEVDLSLEAYAQGRFTVLDVELGGACNLNCVYCDSPNRTGDVKWKLKDIARLLSSNAIRWLFVCGIGEPLVAKNRKHFLDLLHLAEDHGTKCSVFTNGVTVDKEVTEYVKKGVLSVLIKLDSLRPEIADPIYGAKVTTRIVEVIKDLASVQCATDGVTTIGVSIVPTRANVDEITRIVDFCCTHRVYPLIGQLEAAGRGGKAGQTLALSDEQLQRLKANVSAVSGQEYVIPTCPAVVAGIHVGREGHVIVDKLSGLSCHWFWLTEPCPKTLCPISRVSDWNECAKRVTAYRASALPRVEATMRKLGEMPFGGCGGNARDLLARYIVVERRRQNAEAVANLDN